MKSVLLKKNKQEKFKQGYLLIENDDIYQKDDIHEGELFIVQSDTGQHLGTFYCGLQNRGFGWKVSEGYVSALETSYFINLFETAKEFRASLFNATDTNAFRLYNGEGDGLGGFTIDSYDGHLLIQWYSKGIYQFKTVIVEAIQQIFEYKSIFEKLRYDKNVTTHQITDETVEFPIMILENNLSYMIDLNDGAMTGLFLDQRDVRKKLLKLETKGNDFLNLFAYSGGFSIAAATNSYKTTNVDIAKRSIQLMEQNFAINELPLESQKFYTLDAFDALKYFARHLNTFDAIIIDPPSFSRNKKKVFSVKDNYHELIEAAVPLVNYNGYLILSTNASNVPLKQFKKMITDTLMPLCQFEIESIMGLPKDFKTTDKYKASKYLKVITIKILSE